MSDLSPNPLAQSTNDCPDWSILYYNRGMEAKEDKLNIIYTGLNGRVSKSICEKLLVQHGEM